MEFFRTIRKSVYDRAFYVTAKTENFAVALKYYSLFIVCMAILVSIPLAVSFGAWSSQVKTTGDIRTKALAIYPDELVLTFQDGQMTSNVKEPYAIPMPKEFNIKELKNIIVINTNGSITPDDFNKYDTSAILGKDAVWIYDREKDKIEIQQFSKFNKGTFVLNKQKVTGWVDSTLSIGKVVVTALFVFLPFILFALFWFGYLTYLLFGAIIIWIVAKLRKTDLSYGQAYKLGLSLITLPILYTILTTWLLPMFKFPFGFTIILAAIAYANFGSTQTSMKTPEATIKDAPSPDTTNVSGE